MSTSARNPTGDKHKCYAERIVEYHADLAICWALYGESIKEAWKTLNQKARLQLLNDWGGEILQDRFAKPTEEPCFSLEWNFKDLLEGSTLTSMMEFRATTRLNEQVISDTAATRDLMKRGFLQKMLTEFATTERVYVDFREELTYARVVKLESRDAERAYLVEDGIMSGIKQGSILRPQDASCVSTRQVFLTTHLAKLAHHLVRTKFDLDGGRITAKSQNANPVFGTSPDAITDVARSLILGKVTTVDGNVFLARNLYESADSLLRQKTTSDWEVLALTVHHRLAGRPEVIVDKKGQSRYHGLRCEGFASQAFFDEVLHDVLAAVNARYALDLLCLLKELKKLPQEVAEKHEKIVLDELYSIFVWEWTRRHQELRRTIQQRDLLPPNATLGAFFYSTNKMGPDGRPIICKHDDDYVKREFADWTENCPDQYPQLLSLWEDNITIDEADKKLRNLSDTIEQYLGLRYLIFLTGHEHMEYAYHKFNEWTCFANFASQTLGLTPEKMPARRIYTKKIDKLLQMINGPRVRGSFDVRDKLVPVSKLLDSNNAKEAVNAFDRVINDSFKGNNILELFKRRKNQTIALIREALEKDVKSWRCSQENVLVAGPSSPRPKQGQEVVEDEELNEPKRPKKAKEKTRGQPGKIADDDAEEPQGDGRGLEEELENEDGPPLGDEEARPVLKVARKKTVKTMRKIFLQRGAVAWGEYRTAMEDVGFDVVPGAGGSEFRFAPRDGVDIPCRSVRGPIITVHRPHGACQKFTGHTLMWLKKRLQRRYGWDENSFAI